MERVKKLERSTEESLGIWETVCMKSVVRNWRDPTHHRKVKRKRIRLQNKLYLTAKKCDSRRFHALYDKVYRDDVLFEAWKRVKANKGSSGVDGIKIEDIEAMGIAKYLSEIKSDLMAGRYKPSPVKRVMIPKPDGSERLLGIPTVKDRIVQMATKIAIEPVFEADFRECSYGFRPKRSAKQALEIVRKACNNKGYYVVDADIEKFFDNVNQDKLMKLVESKHPGQIVGKVWTYSRCSCKVCR